MHNLIDLYKFVYLVDDFEYEDIINRNLLYVAYNDNTAILFNDNMLLEHYHIEGFKLARINKNDTYISISEKGIVSKKNEHFPVEELLYKYIITRRITFTNNKYEHRETTTTF